MTFSGHTTQDSTTIVSNDGFFPDLGVGDFQRRYRLPAEYAEDVLVDGLQLAMAWANKRLAVWRAGLTDAQRAGELEDIESAELGDETLLMIHYRRAVFSFAKAYALRQYPTIDRRESAANEGKESPDAEVKFMEYAETAIADFLGVNRITVELI